MVYIYKKIIGSQPYYYLRASVRKNEKTVNKDIKYLGSDLESIKRNITNIPVKYSDEIRKSYKREIKIIKKSSKIEKFRFFYYNHIFRGSFTFFLQH